MHFFWGAFDLAESRFSGRPAPQHPGEGSTYDDPSSTWPHTDAFDVPRPSVVVSWRKR